LANRAEYIKEARAKFDSYNADEWIKAGFDEHSGGYCVYHKEHRFDPTKGIFGFARGKYEKFSSKIFMKYGMRVELSSEEQGENKEGKKIPQKLHKLKNAGNKSPANEVLGSPLSP